MADSKDLNEIRDMLDMFNYGSYEFDSNSQELVKKLLDDVIQLTDVTKGMYEDQ